MQTHTFTEVFEAAQAVGNPKAFFTNLCNVLLVPHLNLAGGALTEFERLNKFLESGFLLIDAQDNLIEPQNPAYAVFKMNFPRQPHRTTVQT